ncbi:LPS assembly protein LptD [Psychromonas sp. MME2]|uniref:LPS assembly protein LptD n=1 Tax=Psychromonas sp. MME2 TaxID=3231033 RepID=UPI00339CFD90
MFINTELKYMATFYNQDLPQSNKETWYNELDDNVNRYIPSFKVNSGINFERYFSAFGGQYKQTLVPQIQYLYVPYKNQDNIGIYDSTKMQLDYYGLFRDNRYSGYDRIADANQITVGVSSSFLNPQGEQKMRFAIGQNYYFDPSKTRLPEEKSSSKTANRSSIIGEFDINFDDQYFFHSGVVWNADDNIIDKANATFEKRWLYDTYAQLNYRYIAKPKNDDRFDEVAGIVKQLGSKVNWAINSQWSTFASYYYDFEYNHIFEQIVGIKYQSCCWAFGITYDNHMLPYYGSLDTIGEDYETEQTISFTFELMGLGGAGDSDTSDGLFNYGRPFYLQ